jgi:hypothetical protein
VTTGLLYRVVSDARKPDSEFNPHKFGEDSLTGFVVRTTERTRWVTAGMGVGAIEYVLQGSVPSAGIGVAGGWLRDAVEAAAAWIVPGWASGVPIWGWGFVLSIGFLVLVRLSLCEPGP